MIHDIIKGIIHTYIPESSASSATHIVRCALKSSTHTSTSCVLRHCTIVSLLSFFSSRPLVKRKAWSGGVRLYPYTERGVLDHCLYHRLLHFSECNFPSVSPCVAAEHVSNLVLHATHTHPNNTQRQRRCLVLNYSCHHK